MRQGLMTSLDWALIGATLANEDDHDMVLFFKAFLHECKSWGISLQVERQLAMVNSKLTKEERQALSMLSFEEEDSDETPS